MRWRFVHVVHHCKRKETFIGSIHISGFIKHVYGVALFLACTVHSHHWLFFKNSIDQCISTFFYPRTTWAEGKHSRTPGTKEKPYTCADVHTIFHYHEMWRFGRFQFTRRAKRAARKISRVCSLKPSKTVLWRLGDFNLQGERSEPRKS